ncbi:hypothetical protein KIW84_044184 [Lathyrus oleraceus]|uniref:DUF7745 domain-containing protein n=1 Tax=Pisum sativum TaxID=3888 RepID=A0A9D4XHU4_PEA|nr:hypothetical protein KIW84_044184 [Pisum sativum]
MGERLKLDPDVGMACVLGISVDASIKIKQAWTQIHRKELGKHECRAKEPYRQWVVQRVKDIKLPYNVDVQVPSSKLEPVYASKEEVEALKATIAPLTKENEDLRSKLQALNIEHAKLKRKSEEDIEDLKERRKKAKIEENLNDKYQDNLSQADMRLTSLRKPIEIDKK